MIVVAQCVSLGRDENFKYLPFAGLKLGFSIEHGTLHNVSLGQGQEKVAERVLNNASKLGHWVILQVGSNSN